ncbi:unnamed protein product [Calicophoron daubneyi]|uniref:Uncharacterized protein n=1 Tax=Calicophoron daubneyi TaxID=300641 RepID=A0AAV2TSR2_CALDB
MHFFCSVSTCILCILIIPVARTIVTNTSSIRDEIVNVLFDGYQNNVSPGELTHNQTVVVVWIAISAITSVDVRKMEFTTDFLLRQRWYDPRLAWDHIPKYAKYTKNIVSPTFKEIMWLPDLFFRNGKEGRLHNMTCDNLLIRIEPDGMILYSQKITMRLACQMDLRNFPMDTQECGMDIGSYGYTLNQLRFLWHNETPISIKEDLQISEFDPPKTITPFDCSSLYATSTGQYACLQATFLLSRKLGYWCFVTYIPNILIMIVSWLNFWVNLEATPARVNLSLLTLLGLITQASGYASTLPRVSYLKAIDVWTTACYAFNSGVLLEFAIALHVSRRHKTAEWRSQVRKIVRRELVRWCYACQQEFTLRGPSASVSYLLDSKELGKLAASTDSVTSAAVTLRRKSNSPTRSVSDRLGDSGYLRRRESAKPLASQNVYSMTELYESENNDVSACGLGTAQTDALLPQAKKHSSTKKPRVSEVDRYMLCVECPMTKPNYLHVRKESVELEEQNSEQTGFDSPTQKEGELGVFERNVLMRYFIS